MTKGGKNGILQWQKEANSKTLTGQTDKYRLEQFRNQQIDKIKISKITTRNYEIASVKIYIGKNYHKVDFGGIQCNFTNSLQRAEQFSLKLVPENKIVIQACLEELTNLTNYKREDRLLVNSFSQTQHGDKVKYEKVSGKNINLIKISSTNVRGSRIVSLKRKQYA